MMLYDIYNYLISHVDLDRFTGFEMTDEFCYLIALVLTSIVFALPFVIVYKLVRRISI